MSLCAKSFKKRTFVSLILMFFMTAKSLHINNAGIVKVSHIPAKEAIKVNSYSALFAKIPQEWKLTSNEIFSHSIFPQNVDLGKGSTNQIAKILFPTKASYGTNNYKYMENTQVIEIPVIKQPFEDYTIVVAIAPRNVKIRGSESKPVVVYIVFPDDDQEDVTPIKIPNIYFVTKAQEIPFNKNIKIDPILIIDSNRTVTGLKSNKLSKIVRFKNKLTSNFN